MLDGLWGVFVVVPAQNGVLYSRGMHRFLLLCWAGRVGDCCLLVRLLVGDPFA